MKLRRRGITLLLLSPGAVTLLMFTAFAYYLMVEQSFFKTNFVVKEFIGFKNYIDAFKDPGYHEVFGASFLYAALICPSITLLPLVFALMLYNTPKGFQQYVKFIVFVPSFASGVIISQVWRWIYQPRLGLLNYLLGLLGIAPVVVMGKTVSAIIGISVMSILGGMGLPLLLYLSSIEAIEKETFDAAKMDGANNHQIRWKIIFPYLLPTMFLLIMMTMGSGFYLLGSILVMTEGLRGTANFMYDIFTEGTLRRSFGMASAKSVLLFFIVIGMIIIKRKVEKHVLH